MENKAIILNELKEISPVVAGISNRVPYTAPPSYFDELPVQVMLRIAVEEKTGSDPILTIDKVNTYEVPQGYFEGLAGTILNRVKAMETEHVKDELELLSPLLGRLEKKNPFNSPAGYFDDLSTNIISGVQAIEFVNEELENLSPLMNSLKEKNVYAVPLGYFDNLAGEVLNKVHQQPAKIISIGFGKKLMRYAAAAVVVGIMATGAYKIINPSVPEQDPMAKVEKVTAKATDAELENFLNSNTISLADTSNVTIAEVSEDDTKDLLADVSDEELQQYLEQHGGTVNSVTN